MRESTNVPPRGWTVLQRQQGSSFLQWLEDRQALRTEFSALTAALRSLLEDWVRTKEDVDEVWAAVPSVMRGCNDQDTYRKRGAARAYAWLHLLDRYVRTWLALRLLVEQRTLPMGKEGVRVLDVGTGPGPSAFAVHDFFAAMVRYAEGRGNESWRQPTRIACVEFEGEMNHFRHHLAERLVVDGAPKGTLDMCGHIRDFESISPVRERMEENDRLRNAEDLYWDEDSGKWASESQYTPEEANWMANRLHRYRLFTFSNFLTTKKGVQRLRQNLIDILSDAHPGSVMLLIGAKGRDYPEIYRDVAGLAQDTGFSRKAESGTVACSDAGMDRMVHAEQVWFYRRLRYLGAAPPAESDIVRDLVKEFEGEKPYRFSASAVRAWRK